MSYFYSASITRNKWNLLLEVFIDLVHVCSLIVRLMVSPSFFQPTSSGHVSVWPTKGFIFSPLSEQQLQKEAAEALMVLKNTPQSGPILATPGLLPTASSAPALMASPSFPHSSEAVYNPRVSSPFKQPPPYFMPPYSIHAVKSCRDLALTGTQMPPEPVSDAYREQVSGPLFLPLLHGGALPQQYKNVRLFSIAPPQGPQVATSLMVSSIQAIRPSLGGASSISHHNFAPNLTAYHTPSCSKPKTIHMPEAIDAGWISETNSEVSASLGYSHGSPQLLPFCIPPMDVAVTPMPLQTGVPYTPIGKEMYMFPRLSLLNPTPYILAQQSFPDTSPPVQRSSQCDQQDSQGREQSSREEKGEENDSSQNVPGSKDPKGEV